GEDCRSAADCETSLAATLLLCSSQICARVVRVCIPCRRVAIVSLITPRRPTLPGTATEELEVWTRTTGLDYAVLFIWLISFIENRVSDIIFDHFKKLH